MEGGREGYIKWEWRISWIQTSKNFIIFNIITQRFYAVFILSKLLPPIITFLNNSLIENLRKFW